MMRLCLIVELPPTSMMMRTPAKPHHSTQADLAILSSTLSSYLSSFLPIMELWYLAWRLRLSNWGRLARGCFIEDEELRIVRM